MRTPALSAFGTLCGLITVTSAIPALKYSGIVESCGVTTIYVTVVPISSTTAITQLPNTSLVDYSGVAKPSSATTTAYGNYVYSIVTMKTQPSCSDDLVICPEISVLNSFSILSAVGVTSGQLTGSTSTPPEIYVVETLTVKPLATIPTSSISTGQTTTLTIQSTMFSTTVLTLTDVAASTPVITIIVYGTGLPGPAALSSYSGSYPSSGPGGWSVSISPSSVSLSSSSLASIGTGISSTLVVDALSNAASTTSSYSSESINFSNSYLLANVSSALVAQSGFTVLSISLLTAPTLAQTTSEAAWTESCSEDESATSTTDAGQYTVMSITGTSSSSFPLPSSSSPLSLLNSTTMSGYTFSTGFSASSKVTSQAGSAQSTSSGFAGPTLSSFSSVSAAVSTMQLSSSSSFASTTNTTTTTATTTFSTLTTSFLPIVSSPTSSSVASEVSPANTTSYDLPTPSPSSALSSGANGGYSSWISSATSSQLTSTSTSGLTTSVLPSFASPTYPTVDTCTEPIVTSPSSPATSTPTSTILIFTTLISSVSLSASSSTTSLSVQPTACGEHGAFTLNFDDLPPLAIKDNSTAQPMPLFSPYHQFYFSDGWTIVPPPTDPYLPSSPPLLVEFLPDPDFALGYTGAMGNGENALLGCFNFNALGMSLGCDSTGPNCDWQFTGLRYNNVTKATDTITSQILSTAACPALSNCTLVPVFLDSTFQNLTELRINVTVAGVDKIWWLDNLNLSWYDDSCNAGLCRQENS